MGRDLNECYEYNVVSGYPQQCMLFRSTIYPTQHPLYRKPCINLNEGLGCIRCFRILNVQCIWISAVFNLNLVCLVLAGLSRFITLIFSFRLNRTENKRHKFWKEKKTAKNKKITFLLMYHFIFPTNLQFSKIVSYGESVTCI